MGKKITHEEYLQQLKDMDIYIFPLKSYIDCRTKIPHKCICGNVWDVTPQHVKKGRKCGCGNTDRANTQEEYLKKLKEKNIAIYPLEKYQNLEKPIKHKCTCGNVWRAAPSSILQGNSGCGCKKRIRLKTHKWYLQELQRKDIKVIPLQKYDGRKQKILHKCTCGNVWNVTPQTILSGCKCGCVLSFGEQTIFNFLKYNNFEFDTQKTFKNCKDKYVLRYDFAIYSNHKIAALVEYHGAQHFKLNEKFHKDETEFLESQKRDQIKRDYAAANGIPLIEITYKEKDIAAALERELQRLGAPLQLALL